MPEIITKSGEPFDRAPFESLLRRRMFFTESFEIYRTASNFHGDNRGLYDFGPPGCGLQANVVDLWRKHFVLEENMLEVDCTMLTHEDVFKTSGHVDKFADYMCKDLKKGDYLRADHLIESVLEARLKGDKDARGETVQEKKEDERPENAKKKKSKVKDIQAKKLDDATVKEYEGILAKIDNFDGEEMGVLIKTLDIKNPDGDGEVSSPMPFNLMFQTTIGPSSASPGYLRPETAQGQFLNFKKLLEFNQNTMPFASASIGKSFRNEISPRSGLLRVREFLMAEIEHYVDPEGGKKHDRFDEVKHLEMALLDRHTQLAGKSDTKTMTVGQAVVERTIDNETLGYFLARTQLFLEKIGADMSKVRFRQHMMNEMAHYAADCWDAELLTSYGWIECVGCADRSAYDLTVHAKRTKEPLVVRENRTEPLKVEEWQVDVDRKILGPHFKRDVGTVVAAIEALSQSDLEKWSAIMKTGKPMVLEIPPVLGKVELNDSMVYVEKRARIEHVREYTPNVIEPSFGIGRLLYSVLEHVYWHRVNDAARGVRFHPNVPERAN